MRVSAAPAFANRRSNPYNAMLYDALSERGVEVVEFGVREVLRQRPDVVHVHWPESALNKPRRRAAAFRSVQLLVVLGLARRRGARVVWTAHNARSHFRRYPRAERLWWHAFVRLVDGWISLSSTASAEVLAAHPRLADRPTAVVAHGHYRGAYPDGPAERFAPGRTVVFAGRVKPYKGVPELLAAFSRLDRPDVRLVVAGRCDDAELAAELSRTTDPRVDLRLREIPESEVVPLLRGADLVVLPFRAVLNSGSAMLALSFGAPVLCPATGALAELADAVPGWVLTYDGELTAEVISAALDQGRPAGLPDLSCFDWSELAGQTLAFYLAVLAAHAGRR